MRLHSKRLTFLFLFLLLSACAQTTEEPTPVIIELQTPVFPPTWTPTPRPTQNVITSTPLPEFGIPTPTPTMTSTPPAPPEGTLPPTPTVNFSRYKCTVSTNELGIELYQAPYFSDSRILPTMEPGYAYNAVEDFPTMTRLLQRGETAGWVDYQMIAIHQEGPDCGRLPIYPGDLSDFDDVLCFMVADPPAETYMDAGFTVPEGTMITDDPAYVISGTSNSYYGSCVGHAGPCFYVNPADVELVGRCDDLPRSGETITETQLWSDPNPERGSVIHTIPAGEVLLVQAESATGSPPPGGTADGTWLRVKLTGPIPILNGWVWSSFIRYR